MEPSVFTSAAQPQRSETSRSVAAILTSPARASARTLDRIGIEFFRSTIPCTSESSLTRSLLRTVISMDGCYLLLLTNDTKTFSFIDGKRRSPNGGSHGNRPRPSDLACVGTCARIDRHRPTLCSERRRAQRRPRPRGNLCTGGGKGGQLHRNACTKLLISRSNSGSFLRRPSIFRTEWITVEWCLPPNPLPISGSEASVKVLVRYIAICRGTATDLALLRAFISVSFTL